MNTEAPCENTEAPFFCQNLADLGDDPEFPEWVGPNDLAKWRWINTPGYWFVYCVYAPVHNTPPLYIGITNHIHRRLCQHRSTKAWWPLAEGVIVSRVPTEREARDWERNWIRLSKPLFNTVHNCHA